MPLRLRCALAMGLTSIVSGCASEDVPRGRPTEAYVPRAVRQLAADSVSASTGTVGAASFESNDGWHPAGERSDASASKRIDLVAGETKLPPSPVPPAPAPDFAAEESSSVQPIPALSPEAGGKPIDLGAALALVAGQNPAVNFARARVRESYASLDAAEALWLPTLQAGASYHHHEGQLQDVGGRVLNINRTSINGGFGAGAVGAGSVPRPGLMMNFHLADAVFAPEIARRSAWASRHAADATVNDQLLAVAVAYLDLLEASQQLAIARSTQGNIEDLTEITQQFAETGQGLRADANRAETERALRRNAVLQAEEAVAVASARLAELLRFDASVPLQPIELGVVPLNLSDSASEPRALVSAALSRRPELREQTALVEAACQRLQREKYAPLVPSVLLGASYSGFGGGIGADVNNFGDRTDLDALAIWQVRGLGIGERAARAEASARVDQARFRQLQTMDRVAREVVEAKSQVESRRGQVAIAAQAVQAAESSFRLNRQRIGEAQGLPIEALQAIQALDAAQREYLRAVTDFNEAQFRLHRALGWPIDA